MRITISISINIGQMTYQKYFIIVYINGFHYNKFSLNSLYSIRA